jgi:ABC-2 type transport system permease protein
MDGEIMSKIVNGDVGVELCRPLDLYFHWFAKTAAGRLGGFWWRGIITLAIALALPGAERRLPPPGSAAGFALFLISVAAMFMLSNAFAMFVTSIRVGITWGEGPTSLMMLICGVLSGAYLPLPFWPDFMQPFLYVQPFAGQLDLPVRLYSGVIRPAESAPVFALQLTWTVIFIAAGRVIMRGKLSRIIIQGG